MMRNDGKEDEFRKLASGENVSEQWRLATSYSFKQPLPWDYSEAVEWHHKNSMRGSMPCCSIANCYGSIFCICIPLDMAVKSEKKVLKEKALREGANAQYYMGVLYESEYVSVVGNGFPDVREKAKKAEKWYRKAAENGHAFAQFRLGILYDYGKSGLQQDAIKAEKWYRKSAEQGNQWGQLYLGIFYEAGRGGLSLNEIEAEKWYRKSAEQGNEQAQVYLAMFYEYGRGGLLQNDIEAIKYYDMVANSLSVFQHNMGLFYEYGRGGLQQDIVRAESFYRSAIKTILDDYNLALFYERGFPNYRSKVESIYSRYSGIKRFKENISEVIKNEEARARLVHRPTIYYESHGRRLLKNGLNILVYYHQSVEQAHYKAVELYKQAAEQGSVTAQCSLGRCYEQGIGIISNTQEALKWYERAAAEGDSEAKKNAERIRAEIEAIAKSERDARESAERVCLEAEVAAKKDREAKENAERIRRETEAIAKSEREAKESAERIRLEAALAAKRDREAKENVERIRREKEMIAKSEREAKDSAERVHLAAEAAAKRDREAKENAERIRREKEKDEANKTTLVARPSAPSVESRAAMILTSAQSIANNSPASSGNAHKASVSMLPVNVSLPPVQAQGNERKQSHYVLRMNICIPYSEIKWGKQIGTGSFGTVYAGEYRCSKVAIKLLNISQVSEDTLKMFYHEAEVMINLRADSVVQLQGISIEEPRYCLVMEQMTTSLYTALRNSNVSQALKFTWVQSMKWAVDIARGLAYLHASGVTHQDLKSLNVLLDENNKAKLADFGLSNVKINSRLQSGLQSATVFPQHAQPNGGTLAWKAPELLDPDTAEKGPTQASDMYSYGMVLWEIVTGKIPWERARGEPSLIMGWVMSGKRETIPTDCPPRVAHLIKWCWDPNPSKRPQAVEARNIVEEELALPVPVLDSCLMTK